jgi:hypothetical protein
MSVNYAPSYIDEVFERRDDYALDTIITVRAKAAPLPDECALFTRMNAWFGSDWQYYEATKEEDFIELCRLLKKFGMQDMLTMYIEGRKSRADNSEWFWQHRSAVFERLFEIAKRSEDFLKKNEG